MSSEIFSFSVVGETATFCSSKARCYGDESGYRRKTKRYHVSQNLYSKA